MSQALPCVLLRFEGPCSWDLLRTCIQSLTAREATEIHWITDAVLPVETEASENYVWNSIVRRLGEGMIGTDYSYCFTSTAILGRLELSPVTRRSHPTRACWS